MGNNLSRTNNTIVFCTRPSYSPFFKPTHSVWCNGKGNELLIKMKILKPLRCCEFIKILAHLQASITLVDSRNHWRTEGFLEFWRFICLNPLLYVYPEPLREVCPYAGLQVVSLPAFHTELNTTRRVKRSKDGVADLLVRRAFSGRRI